MPRNSSNSRLKDQINVGFLPLLDSSILVAAKTFGFADEADIELNLFKETSWANIRDRMAVGHFDAAHMLAPMPIAANLGLSPLPSKMIAPMALGLGGNAVTVSLPLYEDMAEGLSGVDAAQNGKALKETIKKRKSQGEPLLRLGVVHPYSGHNMELRYWLSASGINPDSDVEIVIVPPPYMADALKSGQLDGYCVGEPWNSVAVAAGDGAIITVKAAIWQNSPEKVLALNADWAEQNGDLTDRFLRALYKAAEWCGQPENHAALAETLGGRDYFNMETSLVASALSGRLQVTKSKFITLDDFFIPFDKAATFPWKSHALWFYSQLVRWGMIEHSKEAADVAKSAYRPDILRTALMPLNAILPEQDAKLEGAKTGGFFDEKVFDPSHLDAYIASFA